MKKTTTTTERKSGRAECAPSASRRLPPDYPNRVRKTRDWFLTPVPRASNFGSARPVSRRRVTQQASRGPTAPATGRTYSSPFFLDPDAVSGRLACFPGGRRTGQLSPGGLETDQRLLGPRATARVPCG